MGFGGNETASFLAAENEGSRSTGKPEVFERLLPPRKTKLKGCGKVIWVCDTADWEHWVQMRASTNAGYFQRSGIHAAQEAGS
jgi:hypothetical protein